jgi:cell wall-associated NlpC family hydrolase
LNRITSRRAAVAAGAALLLVTSASEAPDPAAAVPPPPAVAPVPFTVALPATAPDVRLEHAASRGLARLARRFAPIARARPLARKIVRHRARHLRQQAHHTVRHRAARHHTRRHTRQHAEAGGGGLLGAVYAFAVRQLGEPYAFGADGPGSWDCSGLTSAAYARVGVRLPHRAAGQARLGVAVRRAQARVGDLVVWGSHHVGLYAGHGRVLHAPRPGERVQIAQIWGSPTFRRVTHA